MAKNPETVKIARKGNTLSATVAFDPKAEYSRPTSKKTGKLYREVLAQVGNSFGAHYIGDGLWLRFELSRGDAPGSTTGSAVVIE